MSETKEVLKTFEEFSKAVIQLYDKKYDIRNREERARLHAEIKKIRLGYLNGARGNKLEYRRRLEQMDWMQIGITNLPLMWVSNLEEAGRITLQETKEKIKEEQADAEEMRRRQTPKERRGRQALEAKTHKSLVKKIIKKEEKGVALEHTLSYLTHEALKGNVEIKGDWNAKTRMVLEFVALKFAESAMGLKKEQKEFFENRNAIDEYCEEIQKAKEELPKLFEESVIQIVVDPSELRERFNIKDLYTNKQICEIALSIPGTYLRGNTRLFYDPKQKKYLSVQFSCGLCNVFAIKTGQKEKHTGGEKYHLLFKFYEKISIIFIANIFNLRLNSSIPNYYRLPDPAQDITRIVRWQKRTPVYSLRELAKLFNLKVKHVTRARYLVENCLNKVIKERGIKSWSSSSGKGWKKLYKFKY